jgi:saccharopine dehydrogenase (NAD+, L-lysine-forming)
MLAACIRTRTHYLDLAGEWPVFAAAMACSPAAGAARVMLMPGVGFSLVASDCLLALAAASVPDAALLRLCISQPETIARGTVRSAVGQAAATVLVRRGGQLRAAPAGSLVRAFDFGDGARPATAITLPDIVTGQFTTGVADIETYCEADWTVRLTQLASAAAAPWMKTGAGQALASLYSLAWPPARPADLGRRGGGSLAAIARAAPAHAGRLQRDGAGGDRDRPPGAARRARARLSHAGQPVRRRLHPATRLRRAGAGMSSRMRRRG